MRISDWSSDVCSSDLAEPVPFFGTRKAHQANGILTDQHFRVAGAGLPRPSQRSPRPRRCADQITHALHVDDGVIGSRAIQQALQFFDHLPLIRSEEHTSDLQSLIRLSYAVFCLK